MPAGNLPHALEYIKRGWKIFPLFYIRKDGSCSCKKVGCKRAGKHPITRNGLQDASSEEAVVLQWWTESPYANIGLATGHGGLIVMDVDCSGAKVGLASLQSLVSSNAPLPSTLTVQTGSGGNHYYFLSTKDIKNSAGLLGADLDVRGHGGYVILPPSNHMSGGKYQWSVDIGTAIADMPEWMEALCAKKSTIDISQDIDEKQTAEIQKSINKDKFSSEQLVKLLEYIPADCDRDVWWKVGAALKKELGEKRGWEVWDAWSQKSPDKYDAKAAFTHWQSLVDKGITGGTIYKFAKDNGFRGFDAEAADNPELRDRWLYAISIKRFIETNRLIEWDAEQFNANFAPLFERGKPADHLLKNPSFKRVDGVTYWPKKEQFVEEGGQYKLNYWKPSGIAGLPGDVAPFLDHVKYLFPEELEANILLDYLAFQVQCPGEKVHWAILLEGDQGTGKSYFATVMRLVLGESNVKMVNNEQLHETFTAWQRNTQLIVVEEMMARQRLELMNKLKPMITEPWCTIREMYRPPYEQPNRFNFLFFSNHKDSLIIDNTDRRYCILKSDAQPHPDANAYYGPLFDWTRRNGPALAHFFANRSLGNFKPKAHAPMTAGKRALIEQSMLPLDQFIYDQVETKEYPCQWDLLNASVMVKPLADHNLRANPKEITNAFSRLGYCNLGKMYAGQEHIVMWAVRDFETYRNMSVTQLRQVWLMQVNGTPREPSMDVVDALYKDRAGSGSDALKKKEPM